MADKRLEFDLLGPLEMSVDGALEPLGTPKQRAVLAMLLMNRNSPVAVDRLITGLWEGRPPSGARDSIHSYVSNLRKLLGGVGIDSRVVLAAAPLGYRLNAADRCRLASSNRPTAAACTPAVFSTMNRPRSQVFSGMVSR